MFKHILVPVDGSPTALAAVDKAVAVARAFNASVTVVCVIDPYPFTGVGADFAYGQTEYLAVAMAEANHSVHGADTVFKAAGIQTDARVVESRIVDEGILETAAEVGADLIIMGSHGRRGLQKLLLGSVTQRVLSHGTIPVLVVRGQAEV